MYKGSTLEAVVISGSLLVFLCTSCNLPIQVMPGFLGNRLSADQTQGKKDGIAFEDAQKQTPYAPTNLQVDPVSGRLTWSAPPGSHFRVYRITNNLPAKIAETSKTQYTLPSRQRKAGSCFSVASVSEHNVLSDLSDPVCWK